MKRLLLLFSIVIAATVAGAQQSIITLPVSRNSFCPNDTLFVNFTATGTYTTGNIFNAELSDASGSFATPTAIGALTGVASGAVPATIPAATPIGLGYRVRVIATLPNVIGTDNGTNISIGTQLSSGTVTGPTTVCASTPGHVYTVAPAPGASSYTWTLPAGWSGTSTNNTITVTAGNTSGTILVSANGNCGSSSAQSITVTTLYVPNAPAAILGSNNVCDGGTATFNVIPVIGATTYNWTLPATWTGTSISNTINTTVGPNPGTISVTATNTCGTSAPATRPVGVIPSVTPTAFISTPTTGTLCGTLPVTFTANVTNAGSTPGYQWYRNGQPVGPPSLTYTALSSANGDVITFDLTSSATCALPAIVTSNPITLTVAPGVIASSVPATVCRNGSLQLNATNIPSATYSWTGPGFTSTQQNPSIQTIFNSGYYTVQAASTFCTTRDSILITVNPLPDLTITRNGSQLETTPGYTSYTWAVNGVTIPGATGSDYTPTQPGYYVVSAVTAAGCAGRSAQYGYWAAGIGTISGRSITIFPTPANGELHIQQDAVNMASAAVYNNLGQIVLTHHGVIRNQDTRLDLSTLPAGIYVIALRNASNGETVINRTFVKQ